MAFLAISISIEVSGSWFAILLLFALSMFILQLHGLDSKVKDQVDCIV